MNILFVAPGFDYLSSVLKEGLHLHSKINSDIKFKCTTGNDHHSNRMNDLTPVSEQEFLDNISWADVLAFSSAGNMFQWSEKEKRILDEPAFKKKRVFVDGCDSNEILINPAKQSIYFKRELRYPQCFEYPVTNIRSLLFGIYQYHTELWEDPENIDYVSEFNKRDIDVSFVCFSGSNPIRRVCHNVLGEINGQKGLNIVTKISDTEQPVKKEEYDDILNRSKISVSMIGAGLDTLRFWEIPARGSVLCSFAIQDILMCRNMFEIDRHCIYFKKWEEMVSGIAKVVFDPMRWIKMRKACDHARYQHTSVARADEFIRICKEML